MSDLGQGFSGSCELAHGVLLIKLCNTPFPIPIKNEVMDGLFLCVLPLKLWHLLFSSLQSSAESPTAFWAELSLRAS